MRFTHLLLLFISTLGITRFAEPASSNEEVTFTSNDGLVLEGTLRLPSDVNANVPGVVLLHGSGAISRDSPVPGQLNMRFGFDVHMFRDIGNRLQNAGCAVLTYDKRSCGTFNGLCDNSYPPPSSNQTIRHVVDDAEAAIEYLQARDETGNITVVGHSQSGQFIPALLESNPEIHSGVLLSGPFHPIDYMIELQLNSSFDLLELIGVNRSDAEQQLAPLIETVEGLKAIRNGTSDEPAGGTTAAAWRDWFDIREEALEAAANIHQPLLVLGGELDRNVPPSEAEAWDAYLTDVDADHQVKIIPCVTHAMNCLAESDPLKLEVHHVGREVDSQVTDALIEFVTGEAPSDTSKATTSHQLHHGVMSFSVVFLSLVAILL